MKAKSDIAEAASELNPISAAPEQANANASQGADRPESAPALLYRVVKPDAGLACFGRQDAYPGGRWSSAGTPLVYASLSPGTALLEALVHMDDDEDDDRVLAIASVPAECIATLEALPEQWRERPYRASVQAAGDDFFRSARALALKVPSAVAEAEFNVLLNPEHAHASRLRTLELRTLKLDDRFRRRST